MNEIQELRTHCSTLSAVEIVHYLLDTYTTSIALSSSLGAEDQVLTDMIVKHNPHTRIFTLDTGRLHPETYMLMEKTNTRYSINIEIFFPNTNAVESLTRQKGLFSFYESVENRKECCFIRKVEPLQRALQGVKIWVTGMRREQSITRSELSVIEWDETHQTIKCNPLVEWTNEMVWDYIRTHKVPYNPLHDQGYPSIGCAPCTRAIQKGEDIRGGRWWWENAQNKECGLHI